MRYSAVPLMFLLTVVVMSFAYFGRTEPPRDSCPVPEALMLNSLTDTIEKFEEQIEENAVLAGRVVELTAELERFLETGQP